MQQLPNALLLFPNQGQLAIQEHQQDEKFVKMHGGEHRTGRYESNKLKQQEMNYKGWLGQDKMIHTNLIIHLFMTLFVTL
jgi:hypothetical protein